MASQHQLQAAQPLGRAVGVGGKAEIEGHDLGLMRLEQMQGLVDILGEQHLEMLCQPPLELFANLRAVVHDQQFFHPSS